MSQPTDGDRFSAPQPEVPDGGQPFAPPQPPQHEEPDAGPYAQPETPQYADPWAQPAAQPHAQPEGSSAQPDTQHPQPVSQQFPAPGAPHTQHAPQSGPSAPQSGQSAPQAPGPKSGPSAPPAPQGAAWNPAPQRSGEANFFRAMVDFRFDHFITVKFSSFLYVVAFVVAGLVWLGQILVAIMLGAMIGAANSFFGEPSFNAVPLVLAILFGWIPAVIALIAMRLGLEFSVATVRTAQNTTRLAEAADTRR